MLNAASETVSRNANCSRPKGAPPPPPRRPPLQRLPPNPPQLTAKTALEKNKPNIAILGRRLHWDALQANNIKGTIFQELQEDQSFAEDVAKLLDEEQMKRVFAKPSPREQRKPYVKPIDDKKKFFKGNRAQNIAIVLARLPLNLKTIAEELEHWNISGTLTYDLLEKISEVAPLPEEYEAYDAFVTSRESFAALRDVEQAYLPLFGVQRVRERCRVLLHRSRRQELHEDVRSMLTTLHNAANEVRTSRRFRALLVAVLLWGNFVNHGANVTETSTEPTHNSNNEGGASARVDSCGRSRRRSGTAVQIRTFGFTLPSLLKLTEFKTVIDPSITSLHYIIANMIQSQPKVELHRLHEEMSSLSAAANISASALKESFVTLQAEVDFLRVECCCPTASQVYGKEGQLMLRGLYEESHSHMLQTNELYTSTLKHVRETAAYFGDIKANSRDCHEDFFKTLYNFVLKFQACVRDYQQNTKKFQDVLVASAQNNGLTYMHPEEHHVEPVTVPRRRVLPAADISTPATNPPRRGCATENAGAPTFPRCNYRRSSVGAPQRNRVVVLSQCKKELPQIYGAGNGINKTISQQDLALAQPPPLSNNARGVAVLHPAPSGRRGNRRFTMLAPSDFSLYSVHSGASEERLSNSQQHLVSKSSGAPNGDGVGKNAATAIDESRVMANSGETQKPASRDLFQTLRSVFRHVLPRDYRQEEKRCYETDITSILDEAVEHFMQSEGIIGRNVEDFLRLETRVYCIAGVQCIKHDVPRPEMCRPSR